MVAKYSSDVLLGISGHQEEFGCCSRVLQNECFNRGSSCVIRLWHHPTEGFLLYVCLSSSSVM